MRTHLAAFLGALVVLATVSVPSAAAYYGPSFQTPVSIVPGGSVNIVLGTGSGATIVPLPGTGGSYCTPGVSGGTQTCIYPQQSWGSATSCFYSVHSVTVTDPSGNGYMLGSSATSGLNFPKSLGGSAGTSPPNGQAINITSGDTFTVPFGTGAGGFSYTSVLGNPPNPGYGAAAAGPSSEGPYYWWTVAGNVYGSNLRLDQHTSITPTAEHGTYTIDVEGVVACPTGAATFSTKLFFDAPITFTTPQFPFSFAVVAISGLGLVFLLRKRMALPSSN